MIMNILYSNSIQFFIYLLVNLLFVIKYGLRYCSLPIVLLLCLVYTLSVVFGIRYVKRINIKLLGALSLLLFLSLLVIQNSIDPYSIQVDRWSAIHNFIYNLLHGQYPYSAQTHLGGYGSPFPVWQLFHIPFYFLGNVGLSIALATLVFYCVIYIVYDKAMACYSFLLLLLSPAFVYEVLVRSDLITNFLLVASIILLLRKYHVTINSHYCRLAILCGLVMCTRLSAIIPFFTYYFREYIQAKWSIRISFPIIVLLVFAISFLPFLLWDSEMLLFFEYNPFILQSRQGNVLDFILFIPIGIFLSLNWKDNIGTYALHTACLLILLVVVTFIHNMYNNNNWDQLFESSYDITYFNMCLPFVIVAIINTIHYDRHLNTISA